MKFIILGLLIPNFVFGNVLNARCIVESIDGNTFLIRDSADNLELIVVGHDHRNYFALDQFSKMIRDATQHRGDRVALRRALDSIKSWNNNDMSNYFEKTSGPTLDKIVRLSRERRVDFIGIESPYVASAGRIENIREIANTYRELARDAYGSEYLSERVRRDIVGMFGADWYYATSQDSSLSIEGVDSSLLEKNFGDSFQNLVTAINALDAGKTNSNQLVLTGIIDALAQGLYNRSELLRRASDNLPPTLVEQVEKAVTARDKLRDSFNRRDLQMLRSMKARTNRTGLLVVGNTHIASLREQHAKFCESPRVRGAIKLQTTPAADTVQ